MKLNIYYASVFGVLLFLSCQSNAVIESDSPDELMAELYDLKIQNELFRSNLLCAITDKVCALSDKSH